MGMSKEMRMYSKARLFAQTAEEVCHRGIFHGLSNRTIPEIDKDIVTFDILELINKIIGVECHEVLWNMQNVGLLGLGPSTIDVLIARNNFNEIIPGMNVRMPEP